MVGLAASVGAGISMGFAEALSDDGALTGRGAPLMRGVVCGVMTTAGGIGHTLPYLIADFRVATTVAILVVVFELFFISWIRNKYMETPFGRAAMQVTVRRRPRFGSRYIDRDILTSAWRKTWEHWA